LLLAPVESPPWSLQRTFMGLSRVSSHTAGAWQGVLFRVLAPRARNAC
jgi:hypothetical protein